MCGIAGWLARDGAVDAAVLTAMRERLAHRGPDGAGTWVSPDRRVGLAHRRLSIIDLSDAAGQPMHAEERASIVFNGEVYNHRALRAELEQRGVRFRTDHSDTEVLLRGYLEWGLDALLERLVGMFAFALVDHERGRAFLVRDRVGIKPLYLTDTAEGLLFASEAKALLAHPRVDARLDHESFRHYLSFRAVPAPRTLFEGVECLGPGALLEVDLASGASHRRTWWDPLANAAAPPPSLAAARERLAELLEESLDLRLEADVPVGLFLSGGVDSAYLMRRLAARREGVRTFTVTYPGHDEYDEGADAARLSREGRGRHTPVPLDDEAFARALVEVAWHQDEPIAAPVCTSVWFLARAARDAGVPVVLAGEGSDELFVGYRSWMRLRDAERWNGRLPDLPGRALRRAVHGLAGRALPWSAPELEILRRAAAGQPLFWSGGMDFGEGAKARLLGPAVAPGPSTFDAVVRPLRAAYLERGDARDVTAWMSWVDLRFRLPQLMLPRLDKMGMAASIEGRVPFLDHRIVELVAGLPPAWRGGSGRTPKALFKAVAERELPREFVHREKRGFRAPVSDWKESALGRRYLPALRAFARRTGLLDPTALDELLGRAGDRLWFGLVNFVLWHGLYVEETVADELPELARRPAREEALAA